MWWLSTTGAVGCLAHLGARGGIIVRKLDNATDLYYNARHYALILDVFMWRIVRA
ncbi:MAG: hypothetical protein ACPGWR_04195 [Ardenticatenaceae bacterium]